jgi:hypothetical protein
VDFLDGDIWGNGRPEHCSDCLVCRRLAHGRVELNSAFVGCGGKLVVVSPGLTGSFVCLSDLISEDTRYVESYKGNGMLDVSL